MGAIIEVKGLRKEFQIAKRKEGSFGALRTLFSREHATRVAVDDVTFAIAPGELVGYIGPNGAGKSTTIKMLTGILVPTAGEVRVRGLVPYDRRVENAKQIGVVFGQRTQLWWDLPTIESFDLLQHIYKIPADRYAANMARFKELLGMEEFLQTPVRQLSLGQRMRADLAAALLHDPQILYLDEPTIGLDVVAKEKIREFIREINVSKSPPTTVILTSHSMDDIEALCTRCMIIDHGSLLFDGSVEAIKQRFGKTRTLVVDLAGAQGPVAVEGAETVKQENGRVWLRFKREEVSAAQLISKVMEQYEVKDLSVEEPDLESIISRIYQDGIEEAGV